MVAEFYGSFAMSKFYDYKQLTWVWQN